MICRCWCMAKSPTRRSMCSIARHASSNACWHRCASAGQDCAWCSSTSPRARPCASFAPHAPASLPRSPRSTCCTIATRCSRAGFVPTSSACRCSRPSRIARACWKRLPREIRASSSAPTAHRTRARPRKAPAAAPAYSPRTQPSSCTRRFSMPRACWRGWRPSRRSLRPTFIAWPRNQGSIELVKDAWTVPTSYPFGGAQLVPLRAGERIGWRLRRAE